MSDTTGEFEFQVYVQSFPGPGEKRQISTQGGKTPRWNPRGKELFYLEGNKLMSVSFITDPVLQVGKPELLFEKTDVFTSGIGMYDVSKDGERFLFLQASEEKQASPQLHVVLNWFEELQRRVPIRK